MRILLCHAYFQNRTGEDEVFDDEAALLESRGHHVLRYTTTNREIRNPLKAATQAIWNRKAYRELRALIRRERPDVMHCTNMFPLISPAAYYAARAEGVKTVQSLHNYRMLCVNSLLMRGGQVCEDCVGKLVPLAGVRHGCFRDSRAASAVVAAWLSVHWMAGTWKNQVDAFIAMNDFAREKFIAGGLPAEKIVAKPNFISPDPGPGTGAGGYAIYVGRLSKEKGLDTLLAAWERMPGNLPLKIVGDGPLAPMVREAAERNSAIQWLGFQPRERVHALVSDAALLVAPSRCYEGALPRTILEAFATGTPVIASRLGSMAAEIVPGRTGLLFTPADAADLARKVELIAGDPEQLADMRRATRQEYELKYRAERNYEMLTSLYRRLIAGIPAYQPQEHHLEELAAV